MAGLTLNLLGGFEAALGGQIVALPRKKSRALLSYLALNPGPPHSREKIAGLLWGNSGEEQARASLRQTLTALRRALPPSEVEGLNINGDEFSLDPASAHVDVIEFRGAVSDGTPTALEHARTIYRGELLEGFSLPEPAFQEWLDSERGYSRRTFIDVLAKLLHHHELVGATDQAIEVANQLLGLDPLEEEVHRCVMRLYVVQGRRGLAMRQYEVCRDLLHDELEVAPADETEVLYEAIRTQRNIQVKVVRRD